MTFAAKVSRALALYALVAHAAVAFAQCPTSSPTLVSPTQGQTGVSLTPSLKWSAVAGAAKYDIYLTTGASCSTAVSPKTSTTTDFNPQTLSPNTTYAWTVVPVDANGNHCFTQQMACATFTTGASCPLPASFNLTGPADKATVTSTPTLTWSASQNADKYLVHLGVSTTPAAAAPVQSGTTYTPSTLTPGTYYWYVEAFASCDTSHSMVSATRSFTIASNCPSNAASPSIVAPADGAKNLTSPVTFQWSAVPGATGYSVVASVNGGTRYVVGSANATSLTATVPQGTITWSVVAAFGDSCATTVSKTASFTVVTPTQCGTTPATLIAPANNAASVSSPVTFQWSAVPNAAEYVLYTSTNGTDFDDVAETTSTTTTRIMPAGTISWYVVTKFAACAPLQSATSKFTIPQTACGTGSITLASPANNATVSSPVTFTWSAVSGATSYRLWADFGPGAPVTLATTTSTSATVSLPGATVTWFVEALFSGCPSIVSDHRSLTTQPSASCNGNAAPVLTAPTGTTSENVTFQWTGSSKAIAYRVWVAASGQPYSDIAFTKNTTASATLSGGTYTWYVEAFFEGCPVVQSATGQFTVQTSTGQCTTDAPSLVSPADNATVTSPVRFAWTPVSGATAYRLFAGIDGVNDKLVLVGETDSDETSLVRPMPSGVIRWRVDAVFDTCPSTHSSSFKFTVPKAQNCPTAGADLLTPANGTTLPTHQVEFDWSDVSGASGYVLMAQINNGAATALAETTDSHFTRSMPEGDVEWWVVTFVSGCSETDSPHFHFTVPATNCSTRKPLLAAPRNDENVTSPLTFAWTPVPNATKYKLWITDATGSSSVLATTTSTETKQSLPAGRISWFVEADFASCPSVESAPSTLKVVAPAACATPRKPAINAPGQVVSGTSFTVRWSEVAHADNYELEESTTGHFGDATTTVISGNKAVLTRTATDKPVLYFFRVRAVSNCADERSAYSDVTAVTVIPPKPASNQQHVSAEFGGASGTVVQTVFLPGQSTPVNFTATSEKPWITITPSSGTLPPAGITLTVTADPSALSLGTNTATIRVTYSAATPSSTHSATLSTTTTSVPLSVSLVTPVSPGGKNTPPPDALIIPAVAHATGVADSLFESDIRVTNTSAATQTYQVTFTPSGVDGTSTGTSTTIQVDAGQTLALDDILSSFFGTTTGTLGVLELRPLTSPTSSSAFTSSATTQTTVASSRTYDVTPNGTFGQFIPAIPFSQFIGNADGVLSLQQIAQSAAYRTNFGLVEGAGEPATVRLTVFDDAGTVIGAIDQSLKAGEHLQLNSLLAANNITLADGRVEVAVTSPTGRVTAYASTVDNVTNDPLMVSPVQKVAAGANRYVLPGVGDFNSGFAHWKSDVRIFNTGVSPAIVMLAYYPQGHADTPTLASLTVKGGEVKAIDNFIATVMPSAGTGTAGSLVATFPAQDPLPGGTVPPPPHLVVTGRTYTDTGNGTYGQFIPAVTVADSVGAGDRTLQILQLEQSSRMRTNVGVVETTGNPVTVEVSVLLPDSRVTPKVSLTLKANEFTQIPLAGIVPDGTYNARVAVRVTAGAGKVTAYGSVIDQVTQDPTYVPAQ